ncbi:MAG TPA: GAF domain-containing sensor histidine kinase [Herpetosiphonaceae bacterium]
MDARHEAALARLTHLVLAGADLPLLMEQAALIAAHALSAEHSAIWELSPDCSTLLLRTGVGWQPGLAGAATIDVAATSLIALVVQATSPATSVDWHHTPLPERPPILHQHNVASSLYAVIQGQQQPFGFLSVDLTRPQSFSDRERYFLQAVANVLALAIDRVAAQQTLEQQARDLELENARLISAAHDKAVMEERERLARDLHDSVTQALYGITLHAQAAWRLLAAGEVGGAGDSLHALQETAQEALDEMRLLIFELRPPMLEQVGLVAALQARLNAVEGRAGLQTRLLADGVGELPSQVEQTFYRIAQEALNNALKHAHAQHIVVQLEQTERGVMLEISDDGDGFDPGTAGHNGGLGLRGIAERVAQCGGQLSLRSASGAGTQLRVEVAL